ncbi:hypothetical protein TNCT_382321 [Trichonephila clavata]|uniref:Uncharacterized protein n=1 Tax=Trichonephila clavata TaxID=2740835 RepID=A0A8X6G9B1_TRICU|nr:hypothetical protein TNCT_382321 [Trichonephila clavata]
MATILLVVTASDYEEREPLSKDETIEIFQCVWASMNPKNCDRYKYCTDILTFREEYNYNKCVRKVIPEGIGECNRFENMQNMTEAFSQLYDCVEEHDSELDSIEKYMMDDFQLCITELNKTCTSQMLDAKVQTTLLNVETSTTNTETN